MKQLQDILEGMFDDNLGVDHNLANPLIKFMNILNNKHSSSTITGQIPSVQEFQTYIKSLNGKQITPYAKRLIFEVPTQRDIDKSKAILIYMIFKGQPIICVFVNKLIIRYEQNKDKIEAFAQGHTYPAHFINVNVLAGYEIDISVLKKYCSWIFKK